MKQLYTVLLLALTFQATAQVTIEGTVVDAVTKEALSYVNIGVPRLAQGTVSDLNGNYILELKSTVEEVTFSSIGYATVDIKAIELQSIDTIALTSTGYKISTIQIEASRLEKEEVMLGVRNKTRGQSIAFGGTQLGTELGSIIHVKKPTYIKSAHFVLNHAKGDSMLFRVNIYDYKDGEIGNKLLPEDVFIKEKQRKGTISIDLEAYELVLTSDVLLSLEWLQNFDKTGNEGLTFDTKKAGKKRGIFVRPTSLAAFEKLRFVSRKKPCFYFLGKQIK